MIAHRGLRFRAKVLHDNFLNVTIALMQLANCQQRIDSFLPVLADTDEDTRSKWNPQLPATSKVRSRTAGFLSGALSGAPAANMSRSLTISSISPMLG